MFKILDGKNTKIVGWLLVAISILNLVVDLFDGNGVDLQKHYETIVSALIGAGFIAQRKATEKVEKKLNRMDPAA